MTAIWDVEVEMLDEDRKLARLRVTRTDASVLPASIWNYSFEQLVDTAVTPLATLRTQIRDKVAAAWQADEPKHTQKASLVSTLTSALKADLQAKER